MAVIKKFFPYFLLIFFLLPLTWPLLSTGFIRTDDGGQMVSRLYAFHQTLKTGQFPVRFLEAINHGYGYPVLDFLYPLPFYFGELIHLTFRLGFVDTIKALFILDVLLGAWAMFLLVSSNLGALPGILAALSYSYFPYRVINLYKRGSLGEETAFIFLPLILYFIDRKKIVLAAFAIAGLITSHNVVAFIFLPIILLYSKSIKLIFLALLLSAFFWLPAIFDLNFTRASQVSIAEFFHYFLRYDNPALNDSFLHQVGPVLPVVFLLGLVIILLRPSRNLIIILSLGLAGIFFASPSSEFFWRTFPLPKLVQFPLRFLFLTVFSGSLFIGAITKKWLWLGIVITLMTIFWAISLAKIDKVFYPETYYTSNDGTTTIKNEYLPIWVKDEFLQKPSSDLTILSGSGQVLSESRMTATTNVKLRINRVYFPGWNVFVDGNPAAIEYQKEGFLDITVPAGSHQVNYVFRETPVRLAADLITLVSLALAIWLIK